MPTFDSLKINNAQYDVDLHSVTFDYPLGESKGFCKAMTIPGFYGNWNNRQFFFILYGRHCPCALYQVKYQHAADGTGTIDKAEFVITAYGNYFNSSKTDIIFQKEQKGDSFVLNIWANCYDYGSFVMWNAPRDITVHDYSTAEWVTSEKIPNQIPVKFPIDSDGGTMNGSLSFSATGSSNTSIIKQDTDPNSALQIASYSKLRNVREFTITKPGEDNTWTHVQFKTSSFPYGGDIGVASENWVNDNFLSKTSVSVSGTTLKIS